MARTSLEPDEVEAAAAGLPGHGEPRTLKSVSVAPPLTITLDDRFARELPEMAVPWRAEQAPDPGLLVLNEPLAAGLGLDPDWLRSSDGLRLLVGNLVPAGATPVAQAYPASRRWAGAPAR